jgi:DNA-directed RNA polymerase specialized sigma24 family protein
MFELFRRAVAERDELAWQALHGIFNEQVVSWCRVVAGRRGDVDELAGATWEKFWRNFTPAKLAAASGGTGVLRYLKMCARSAGA